MHPLSPPSRPYIFDPPSSLIDRFDRSTHTYIYTYAGTGLVLSLGLKRGGSSGGGGGGGGKKQAGGGGGGAVGFGGHDVSEGVWLLGC